MKILEILKKEPGILKLQEIGGEIYIVGGCVRDHFLKKESKDIDIVIRLLDSEIIIDTLTKFGKVDLVGVSFGIIKFKPNGWVYDEPIDIALPRIDVCFDKTLGHKGIKSECNPYILIEEDLNRRDFCFNSIAIDFNGNIFDPFNGLDDINNGIIRATSKKAFSEDPLRMLRAIQFMSRFDFDIESETYSMIEQNADDIKLISGERIKDELDKIYHKGNIFIGLYELLQSGLYDKIFKSNRLRSIKGLDEIKFADLIEFYAVICNSEEFKFILNGDNKITKGIEAIEFINETKVSPFLIKSDLRLNLYNAVQISPIVLFSSLIPKIYNDIQYEFSYLVYPYKIAHLKINGEQLMELGYQGPEIGKRLKFLLMEVFKNNRKNIFEELKKV